MMIIAIITTIIITITSTYPGDRVLITEGMTKNNKRNNEERK